MLPPFQMHPEDKALDHQMTLMEELRGSVEMNDDFEDDQDDLDGGGGGGGDDDDDDDDFGMATSEGKEEEIKKDRYSGVGLIIRDYLCFHSGFSSQ